MGVWLNCSSFVTVHPVLQFQVRPRPALDAGGWLL
jgi:hypothetical protein